MNAAVLTVDWLLPSVPGLSLNYGMLTFQAVPVMVGAMLCKKAEFHVGLD